MQDEVIRNCDLIRHVSSCPGARDELQMMDVVTKKVVEFLQTPENIVFSFETLMSEVQLHGLDIGVAPATGDWAKKLKHGDRYGSNYVQRFEEELKVWFDEGFPDKCKKSEQRYYGGETAQKITHILNLPSEESIKKFIGKSAHEQNGRKRVWCRI